VAGLQQGHAEQRTGGAGSARQRGHVGHLQPQASGLLRHKANLKVRFPLNCVRGASRHAWFQQGDCC
jgi:hypothetical protein